ncbi:nuclear transport factor 2 family protein [Archangium violaceum]|uniref:nuclear transport factor 2 family protein n=1 Tax=Archangium violaceum TaxID=83451 RepID=UPI002B2937C8|nr:nuclear transport factor 2 family protein [Archangium violaceum]
MVATTTDKLSFQDEQSVRNMVQAFYTASTEGNLSFFDNHFHHVERLEKTTCAPTGEYELDPRGHPRPVIECETQVTLIDETVFIGTAGKSGNEPGEFIVTHDKIKDFWKSLFLFLKSIPGNKYPKGGLRLTMGSTVVISGHGRVAWVADEPTMWINRHTAIAHKARFTAVLMREDSTNRWTFTQAHLSLGVPNGFPANLPNADPNVNTMGLLGIVTADEVLATAGLNQSSLLLATLKFLKAKALPASDWTSALGTSFLPFWASLPAGDHATFARLVAGNYASCGAKLLSLVTINAEAATRITMKWPLGTVLSVIHGSLSPQDKSLVLAELDQTLTALFSKFAGAHELKFQLVRTSSQNGIDDDTLTTTVSKLL